MSQENSVRLFMLNCAPVQSELDACLERFGIRKEDSRNLKKRDATVREYIPQFELGIRKSAEDMSVYYEIFYLLENEIRKFIETTLVSEKGANWWEEAVPEVVRRNASSSRQREIQSGVTPRSQSMIVYTTFGELGEIIRANWSSFAGVFLEQRAVENVISRLNTLRGPIAHCGYLTEDEVLRLKLSVRDWFRLLGS